ncbi:MAG: GAF domain-containing protein [Sphingobacteriales bacterium]|nr:MAG: GAF domain-containing protein [Sphingobacteriales bacterium]
MKSEVKRLEAVSRFLNQQFDSKKELQDIVVLAAAICETPVALITLLTDDEQVFKFKIGTDLNRTDRDVAFCNYAIQQDDVMVVPDATKDGRFVENTLVTGDPNIKFYAGSPLTTYDGYSLGSLCVIDTKPNYLTAKQQEMLQVLSRQAMNIMELELRTNVLKEYIADAASSANKLRSFFDSGDSCHLFIDLDLNIIAHNKQLETFIMDSKSMRVENGTKVSQYISESFLPTFMDHLDQALQGESSEAEIQIDYMGMGKVWWQLNYAPAYDHNNHIIGVSYGARNINQRKEHEQKILSQYETLMEIAQIQSHGFRRPVASILGLTNLIKEDPASKDEYLILLEDAANELDTLIHKITEFTQKPENNAQALKLSNIITAFERPKNSSNTE